MPQQVKQQIVDQFFPISGVDVSVALESQTPDTTSVGTNVRAFEPVTQRARGGSRAGISRYINATVPNWSAYAPIQLLGVVIDPQADALGVSYPPGGGGFPPLILTSPGAVIFPYGSGFAPSIPPNTLIISAKSQTKLHGLTFTFMGTEFTSNGLQSGDTINSCSFQCQGAKASAPNGTYPISVGNAQISYGNGHTGGPYYILYVPNTMTVSNTPTKVTLTFPDSSQVQLNIGGDGSWFGDGNFDVGEFTGSNALFWDASGNVLGTNPSEGSLLVTGPGFNGGGAPPYVYFSPNNGSLVTNYGVTAASISTTAYLNAGTGDSVGAAVQGAIQGEAGFSIAFS
jgi:hypothetical protein